MNPDDATTEAPEPDWKAMAKQLDGQVRFWRTKYLETLRYTQSQAQVIAEVVRPQMEQDARAQADAVMKAVGAQIQQ